MLTSNDVTSVLAEENIRKRRLEQELEEARQAVRTRTKFLAAFSEQAKNPLNTVIGMTSIIEEEPGNEELVQKSAMAIKSSSDRLLK